MAVVPDKRQLLEHKLATLKTNRNIVLEALQQVGKLSCNVELFLSGDPKLTHFVRFPQVRIMPFKMSLPRAQIAEHLYFKFMFRYSSK